MKQSIILLFVAIFLSSCASIFNLETTKVKISADKKSKIIFNNDTISINKEPTTIRPKRSKKPLTLTVVKDTLQKEFSFKRKLSYTNLLNIYNYGIGFLVDLTNEKRFTYKKNLHFVTDSIKNKIVLSNKKVTFIPKNALFIYTNPPQLFDLVSFPKVTIGIEYFFLKNLSLSAEYGFLAPNAEISRYNVEYLKEKATTYRFETKWYNAINLTENVHIDEYLGLEIRGINSQYNDFLEYYEYITTKPNSIITDNFATKKRVTVFNLKYGILLPIGKRFYFDFYTGLGLRIKKFNHINLEYNREIHQLNESDFFAFDWNRFNDYDSKSFLNISLGFKFGIKL